MRIAALAAVAVVCLAAPLCAQRNEIAISAVGNFNPVSYIFINQTRPEVISSNRSSIGGGVGYQRWPSDHLAFGVQAEQNPSAGKLFSDRYYRWPQMRYEIAGITTQQAALRKTALFIREGAGSILTNGYSNSGWSHDFAILAGFGADYRVSPRAALRAGVTMLASKTGCYNDHTCRETWAVTDDMSLGVVWRF